MKIRVGVIFGGESVEHEVSIISAVQAMYKMDTNQYEVIPIYITKDREWYTGECLKDIEIYKDMALLKRNAKNVVLYYRKGEFVLQSKGLLRRVVNTIDIAFPIVHGTNVEDGVLQGYLQSIGIPFVGSDVYASVVGQDKVFMKEIFECENLPIVNYTWFFDHEYLEDPEKEIKRVLKKLELPVIVKPAKLGSSVGISVAHTEEELKEAIDNAITYDEKILVEELVKNLVEVNISTLGNHENFELSEIEEVMSAEDFLTYQEKYLGNGKKGGTITSSKGSKNARSSHKIPASIDDKLKEEVRRVASMAVRALNSSGVARFDFLIDKKAKKVYINEVNSIPGSLAFYLWEPLNKDYTELLDDMINQGIKDYKRRISKIHSFETNILEGYHGGAKGLKGTKGLKGKLK